MTRGIRISNIFNNEALSKENEAKKGRSKVLNEKRNDALFCRYYYYSKFTKMKYECVIEILSSEFYLSQATTAELIGANISRLKELRNSSPSITNLKNKFPHYNWSIKDIEMTTKT